jgi:hypothetical protein
MATQETQILDDIIVKSRRKMLTLGGAALAGVVLGSAKAAMQPPATPTRTSSTSPSTSNTSRPTSTTSRRSVAPSTLANAAALAAGAPTGGIPISSSTSSAHPGSGLSGAAMVNFTKPPSAHPMRSRQRSKKASTSLFLQRTWQAAVAQPLINLTTAWQMLGGALSPSQPTFSPYASAQAFLLGAYVFEDVGVTAYHGAASLLTVSGNLSAAAGILGVEAYHAGLVRTTITGIDPNATGIGAIAVNHLQPARIALKGRPARQHHRSNQRHQPR